MPPSEGTDLRALVRSGKSAAEIAVVVGGVRERRSDRGAEDRLEATPWSALIPAAALRRNPHLEMHTRGG